MPNLVELAQLFFELWWPQTDRRHAKNNFFWIQWPSKREDSSKYGNQFFGQMQYFLYTSYSRKSKNERVTYAVGLIIVIIMKLYCNSLLFMQLQVMNQRQSKSKQKLHNTYYIQIWNFYSKNNFKIQTCLFI